MWESERTKYECFAKRENSKTINHFLLRGGQQATKEAPRLPTPKLVVKVLAPFRYTSDKAVPWNYSSQAVIQEPRAVVKQNPEKLVNDIVGTGGMTRSGRCYASINSKTRKGENSTKNEGIKIRRGKIKSR